MIWLAARAAEGFEPPRGAVYTFFAHHPAFFNHLLLHFSPQCFTHFNQSLSTRNEHGWSVEVQNSWLRQSCKPNSDDAYFHLSCISLIQSWKSGTSVKSLITTQFINTKCVLQIHMVCYEQQSVVKHPSFTAHNPDRRWIPTNLHHSYAHSQRCQWPSHLCSFAGRFQENLCNLL